MSPEAREMPKMLQKPEGLKKLAKEATEARKNLERLPRGLRQARELGGRQWRLERGCRG